MKRLFTLMVVGSLLAFAAQVNALPITPATAVYTGTQTSTSAILAWLDSNVAGFNSQNELYKYENTLAESGPLAGSYSTALVHDPTNSEVDWSGANITYDGGSIAGGNPLYLLVKDGKQSPSWYLFDLTNIWNGIEELDINSFWLGQGSISHVALYGTSTSAPVPEPATMLLLGSGLVGVFAFGRKRMKG